MHVYRFIFLSLILVSGCQKDKATTHEDKHSQEGVASLEDGSLFEAFCCYNLSHIDSKIEWKDLHEKLEDSIRAENAFRRLGEVGEIGIAKTQSGWIVILTSETMVQVYSQGKVTCYFKIK
jgi:hypothetical protein